MSTQEFSYTVVGTSASGDTWTCEGSIDAEPGDFYNVIHSAMRASFKQLTGGKAVFGNPGKGGCRGPYTITMFQLKRVTR